MKIPLLPLSRRQLGKLAGSIVIAFSLRPSLVLAQSATRLPGSLNNNRMLDAWLRINPDGSATVFTGKVELGQGVVTALAQIAAEELDLPMHRIEMIAAETGKSPDEGFTSGSVSIENGGTALRLAGAEARSLLLANAAAQLGVPVTDLTVLDGNVVAPGDTARIGYGKLVTKNMFHREASATVLPKPRSRYNIVGQSVARLDIPAKVTGGAIFVQDMRLPGMAFGRVVRPPSYRASLTDADVSAARKLPGVIAVVRSASFLGVVAQREEQAIAASAALRKSAKWKEVADLPDSTEIHAWLKKKPAETSVVSEKKGDGATPAKLLQASYTKPYTAHASIGPSCAIAQFTDPGRLMVWSHSQGIYPLRQDLAKALGMRADGITVQHVQGSGCYGHNGADDVALDAALLARGAGNRPVKVQWMRDDENGWEPFGPAMVSDLKAGLAADGSILDWQCEVWSNTHSTRPGFADGVNLLAAWQMENPKSPPPPRGIPQPNGGGDRNAVPYYDFPAQKITSHLVIDMPLRVSSLRTLGGFHNIFAGESFMDELALAAGIDPVEFRLRHLSDPRAKAVIQRAAKQAGWKSGVKGDGRRGRGVGFARYKNGAAYVAVVADVLVDRASGVIKVPHLVAAADAGLIVNPNGLGNQIEGGCIQATSWTLHEAVTFDRQRVTSRDWASYPILTFLEAPHVETILLDYQSEPALGAGEAAQGPTAAAIANAVAHATGRRLRDLPFSPDRVRQALG